MQERILTSSNICEQTETETEPVQPLDNRPIQQLTIEIRPPGHTLDGKPYATVTNHILPYDVPSYPPNQTSAQLPMFLATMPMMQPEATPDISNLSPVRPEMYIVNEPKRSPSSDEEFDTSSAEGSSYNQQKFRKLSQCSDDLDSSSHSSGCSLELKLSPGLEDSSTGPKSTNKDQKRKIRSNYTPNQVKALEISFHENPYPDGAKIETLARDLDIAEAKLKIWFQNKRARWRKRAQDKSQQNNMIQPSIPMIPQLNSYGVLPPYHPMLHGSPASIAPRPFFPPGHPFGVYPHSTPTDLKEQHTITDRQPLTTRQQTTPTSDMKTSPTTSLSVPSSPSYSSTSPNTSENSSPPFAQTLSPYQHSVPYMQPYMPFPYPYMYQPYYYR